MVYLVLKRAARVTPLTQSAVIKIVAYLHRK
jgi:hypothetical protein